MTGEKKKLPCSPLTLLQGLYYLGGAVWSCVGALGPSVRLPWAAASADHMPSFILLLLSFDNGLYLAKFYQDGK